MLDVVLPRMSMAWSPSLLGASAAGVAALSSRTSLNGGCGFDGAFYCRMLQGEAVVQPYNRRILPVALAWPAHKVGLSTPDAFLAIDVACILGSVLIALHLTRLVQGRESGRGTTPAAGLAVAAFIVFHPSTLRTTLLAPVATDQVSLVLVLGSLALLAGRRPWLALPCLLIAPLAREANGPVLALAALALLVVEGRARLGVALASLACLLVGTEWAVTRPFKGSAYSTTQQIRSVIAQQTTAHGLGSLVWNFAIGLGLAAPLIAYLAPAVRGLARQRPVVSILLAASTGNLALALVGGFDTARLLLPTGVLLATVCFGLVEQRRGASLAWSLLLLTIVVWRPWQPVGPDFYGDIVPFVVPQQADNHHVLSGRIRDDAVLLLGAALLLTLVRFLAARGRPRPMHERAHPTQEVADATSP